MLEDVNWWYWIVRVVVTIVLIGSYGHMLEEVYDPVGRGKISNPRYKAWNRHWSLLFLIGFCATPFYGYVWTLPFFALVIVVMPAAKPFYLSDKMNGRF